MTEETRICTGNYTLIPLSVLSVGLITLNSLYTKGERITQLTFDIKYAVPFEELYFVTVDFFVNDTPMKERYRIHDGFLSPA